MGKSPSAKKVWEKVPFDKEITSKMLPVDMYVGGPEHACMHLLYARFVNMVLHDLGYVDFKEPFKRLVHQGMITKDGAKMSKSKGNVVSPDSFIEQYGSDVFRMYLMFMGPFTQGGDWNDKGITGIARFVDRIWELVGKAASAKDGGGSSGESVVGASGAGSASGGALDAEGLKRALHKTIKRVTDDLENFRFNTAISAMMEFLNAVQSTSIDAESAMTFVKIFAPIAPHLAEECHEILGGKGSVFNTKWPEYDPNFIKDTSITYAIQINGKLRGTVEMAADAKKEDVIAAAKNVPNIAKYLEGGAGGGAIKKEIFVPGKIVGFVV